MVSNIFYFHPYLGKMNPIWRAYFSDGLKPPTRYLLCHQIYKSHPEERVGSFASREKVETFMPPLELWNDISKQNRCQWRHIHLFQKTSNRSPLKNQVGEWWFCYRPGKMKWSDQLRVYRKIRVKRSKHRFPTNRIDFRQISRLQTPSYLILTEVFFFSAVPTKIASLKKWVFFLLSFKPVVFSIHLGVKREGLVLFFDNQHTLRWALRQGEIRWVGDLSTSDFCSCYVWPRMAERSGCQGCGGCGRPGRHMKMVAKKLVAEKKRQKWIGEWHQAII